MIIHRVTKLFNLGFNDPTDSIMNMMESFNTEQKCREYLEDLIWTHDPVCTNCLSERPDHYKLKKNGEFNGIYKCKDCRINFNVKIGTMFENSAIPLRKWFYAIYIFTSHKKGISSHQLARDISVTQKTAWFMLSRIRHSLRSEKVKSFDGDTQVDETYIGGKNHKKSWQKRVENTQGRSTKTKAVVFGLLSNGKVSTEIVPNTKGKTLTTIIKNMVKRGSIVVSDGWKGYSQVHKHYEHKSIPHTRGQYVKDNYHTNSIEGFWSLLKRGILGIYHSVSPKHLQLYCDEFSFRYNTKDFDEGNRFNFALYCAFEERLTYKRLIA